MEDDMARTPHLHLRKGSRVYQYRRKIPQDIQDYYEGKKEIAFSLRTSDHREAVEKVRIQDLKHDQEFSQARREIAVKSGDSCKLVRELSAHEIERLAAIVYHDELQDDDEKRNTGMIRREFEQYGDLVSDFVAEGREMLAKGEAKGFERATDYFLEEQGLKLDKDTESYSKLVFKLLESFVQANKVKRERLKGEIRPTPPKPAPMTTRTSTEGVALTITKVHEKWGKEHVASGGSSKSVDEFATQVRRFVELYGDMAVTDITKARIRDFKDAMLRYPACLTKKLKSMTVPRLLEYTSKK